MTEGERNFAIHLGPNYLSGLKGQEADKALGLFRVRPGPLGQCQHQLRGSLVKGTAHRHRSFPLVNLQKDL